MISSRSTCGSSGVAWGGWLLSPPDGVSVTVARMTSSRISTGMDLMPLKPYDLRTLVSKLHRLDHDAVAVRVKVRDVPFDGIRLHEQPGRYRDVGVIQQVDQDIRGLELAQRHRRVKFEHQRRPDDQPALQDQILVRDFLGEKLRIQVLTALFHRVRLYRAAQPGDLLEQNINRVRDHAERKEEDTEAEA